jgi:uncharacterized protein YqeY
MQNEAAVKFVEANRADLAIREEKEAEILDTVLPPLLTTEQIDGELKAILALLPTSADPKKSMGVVFKELYSRVDQANVTSDLVKQRLKILTELLPSS